MRSARTQPLASRRPAGGRLLRRGALAAAVMLAAAACGRSEPSALSSRRDAVISDAVHTSGTPGFYFLFPMVAPPKLAGAFRTGLEPVVHIEELSPGTRGTIATYTTAGGPYGGRVFQLGESYNVLWPTARFALNPAYTYRIHVSVGGFELGYADVDVVRKLTELLAVDTGEYVPLLKDFVLPVRFRIEPEALKCIGVVCSPVDQCHLAGTCDVHSGVCSNPPKPDGTACDDGNACGRTATCQTGICVGGASSCLDLGITTLTGAPTSVVAGGSFSISSTVAATGQGTAGAFQVAYHLSRTATVAATDPLVGTVSVSGLAGGASRTDAVTLTVPADLTPGEYWLGAIVDSANQVAESDETNNGYVATPLNVLGPDLILSAVSAPPGVIGVGDTFEVTDTVVLDAAGPAVGVFTVRYFLSDTGALGPTSLAIGARAVIGLVPGQQDTGKTLLTIPTNVPPGTYQFIAAADPDGLVPDRDVTNNTVVAGTVLVGAYSCQSPPSPVDDGNPCTDDWCDPVSGVQHLAVAAGSSCSDGNACNGDEACDAVGACVAGTPPVVNDGNLCTIDSCDPVLGVRHVIAAAGTSCSDGNLCNGVETCNAAGACVAGTPLVVDDGDACTVDYCRPDAGVVHAPIAHCAQLPPDPSTVAPPNDPTVATDPALSTSFLYAGPNPIQTGVAPGTIVESRVAVVRGLVTTRDGVPLPAVKITVLDHPELGSTLTRSDGKFDVAVNGGGVVTLSYALDGYAPAQRQVRSGWREWVRAEDVALVSYDNRVTVIAAGAAAMQVARGSVTTDREGTRQATVLFPSGTQATMDLPDGTHVPLSTLHVRATEYTVGSDGPKAMPGALPPTSAYTYAVELSVDEAVSAAANTVRFDRPVPFYLENFLGFPVGGKVPVGSYDRRRAAWIPEDDGRVIAIVGATDGLADIDVTGDGVGDDPTTLGSLGISAEERAQIASTYAVGASVWRVPVTHFTPFDLNWPGGCDGDDCPPPDPNPPIPPAPMPDPDCRTGSIIECQNQVLGESAPVSGTDFSVHYSTSRMPGVSASRTVRIPVTGAAVPSNVLGVELRIDVVGRQVATTLPAAPNQTYVFEWDGKDAYGRAVQGSVNASITIGYVYQSVYLEPSAQAGKRSFGAMSMGTSGGGVVYPPARGAPFRRTRTYLVALANWDAHAAFGMGGWSLDAHHAYDPSSRIVLLGNGTRAGGELGLAGGIKTIAGTGVAGYSGDGGPALDATFRTPTIVAAAPDGTLYVSDGNYRGIRAIDPSGIVTTLTGVPFTQGLAVGPDGSLYYAEGHAVRRRKPDGTVTTVAGSTANYGYTGDGGPATVARLASPRGLSIAPDGTIYIADSSNSAIRRVGPDGTIATVAGGRGGYGGDGGPATSARLTSPSDIALAPDGALVIADYNRVRRVGPDGIITTIAGNGTWSGSAGCPDGVMATSTTVYQVRNVKVAPDGAIYISDTPPHVRSIGPDGIIRTVAGTLVRGLNSAYSGDGGPAVGAGISTFTAIALKPDGELVIADGSNNRIRGVRPPFSSWTKRDIEVASNDGRELWVFDAQGRHLRTHDATTGALRLSFGYDPQGLLVSVTDRDGNVTTIERSGRTPTAIVAPNGQRTTLGVDANGFLESIINPAGEARTYSYGASGLMASFTDPRGGVHVFTYDDVGRLVRDENPAGGATALARSSRTDGFFVAATSALGRTTVHDVGITATGDQVRTRTTPGGLVDTRTDTRAGTIDEVRPDGTRIATSFTPDPRFGMAAPVASTTIRTPGGRTRTLVESRAVTGFDPAHLLSASTVAATVTINGRVHERTYAAATRTLTTRTPAGRTATARVDDRGRIVEIAPPEVAPMTLGYDGSGRLVSITQGARVHSIGYDAQGFRAAITDPAGRSVALTNDAVGRVRSATLPGGRTVALGYDRNGNLSSVTPPGRTAHSFAWDAVDRLGSYTPPSVTGAGALVTSYRRDADGALVQVTLPDSTTIIPTYDAAGRPSTVTTGRGVATLAYDASGRMSVVETPEGARLIFGYDGFLPTSERSAGLVVGEVSRTFDDDFRQSSVSVNGNAIASFDYDPDGLLTHAGALGISRDASSGRVTATALGAVTTAQAYDAYGALESASASASAAGLYSYVLTRDLGGRISGKTETVQGSSTSYAYEYDAAGRLVNVTRNGGLVESYGYDASGNRVFDTGGTGDFAGTYDAQDRMTAYGAAAYTYGAGGDLRTKTEAGQTTTYSYDALGNLMAVWLPDGRAVEYVVDGLDRRVGKKVNGAAVEGFLYDGQLRPVAWLDGAGGVKATFVYALHVNVPEYMSTGGSTYRILHDHLGSVRLVVDAATGAVAQRMDYDSFGNVLSDTNPGFQPFGFAGGLYDRDTGLVRFGARDYDASTGRWTNKDPLRFGGGTTNLYEYCTNDPVNFIDPEGEEAITIAAGADAALAAAAGETVAFLGAGAAIGVAFAAGWQVGTAINPYITDYIQDALDYIFKAEEHTKNARPSNLEKHEKGQRRKEMDKRGGEKGDKRRPYSKWGRKKPKGLWNGDDDECP